MGGHLHGGIHRGLLSYPKADKHMVFDGQLLHGTVPQLSKCEEGSERITFLVNIWLNHRPSGCQRLPLSLARRLRLGSTTPCLGNMERVLGAATPTLADTASGGQRLDVRFGRRASDYHLRAALPKPPGGGA